MATSDRSIIRPSSPPLFVKQEDVSEHVAKRPRLSNQPFFEAPTPDPQTTTVEEPDIVDSPAPISRNPSKEWLEHGKEWISILESRRMVLNLAANADYTQYTFEDLLTIDQAMLIAEFVDYRKLSDQGKIALMQCFDLERHRYDRNQPEIYRVWLELHESLRESWFLPLGLDHFISSHAMLMECLEAALEQPTSATGAELYYRIDLLIRGAFHKFHGFCPALQPEWQQPEIHIWRAKFDNFASFVRRLGWAELHRALTVLDLSEKYLAMLEDKWRKTCRLSLTIKQVLTKFVDLTEEPTTTILDDNPYKDLIFERYAEMVRKSVCPSTDEGEKRQKASMVMARMKADNTDKVKKLKVMKKELESLEEKKGAGHDVKKLAAKGKEMKTLQGLIGMNNIRIACLKNEGE